MESKPSDPCTGVTCSNHGTCLVTAENKAFCACDEGYHAEGTDCVIDPSPCARVTCGDNSFCVVTSTFEALCLCDDGYHRDGDKCVLTGNPCAEVDCGEHGRCALGSDGPFCVCDDGFTLQNGVCKETPEPNPCEGVVCAGNGVCGISSDNTAVCYCRPGYYSDGDKCVKVEQSDSPCADTDCGPNGSCVVTSDKKALCICDQGFHWASDTCVIATNPCEEIDCGEHGRCAFGADGAICICDEGFIWRNDACQEIQTDDPCDGVECSGDGVCLVADLNTPVCICRPGYYSDFDNGPKCVEGDGGDAPLTPCAGVTCGGHGTCVVTSDRSPLCICDDGYARNGLNCVKIEECDASVTCSNDWCLIPACTFRMGSSENELCRFSDESPAHFVKISRPFYMKQTEVTQKEWETLMETTPNPINFCGDRCPIDYVTWYGAVSYANALSVAQGLPPCYQLDDCTGNGLDYDICETVVFNGLDCRGYRLPTEAEWEYAARAGTTTALWNGGIVRDGYNKWGLEACKSDESLEIALTDIAWFADNSGGKPHPVGTKLPNPWGLYDVHGNVYEWVHDKYDRYYYGECDPQCTDPLGPDLGRGRVARGGAYSNEVRFIRSAVREFTSSDLRSDGLGFRLVRSVVD